MKKIKDDIYHELLTYIKHGQIIHSFYSLLKYSDFGKPHGFGFFSIKDINEWNINHTKLHYLEKIHLDEESIKKLESIIITGENKIIYVKFLLNGKIILREITETNFLKKIKTYTEKVLIGKIIGKNDINNPKHLKNREDKILQCWGIPKFGY